jgi:hypothetical protein
MVQADRRNSAGQRLHHIGGVEPSAQPDFKHRHIHLTVRKILERQCRRELKKSRRKIGRSGTP